MSADSSHFFEGVEKLLELWFTRKDREDLDSDLRAIPREKIDELLQLAKCQVISLKSNVHLDSYVLSESSLFISKRCFILKTCGKTTPLLCLETLLSLVKEYAKYDQVEKVFYSRKNFKRPELQIVPHVQFDQEVQLLNRFFPYGSAHCLGNVKRDSWYLYLTNSVANPVVQSTGPDQTLEIIMSDLDKNVMKIFTSEFSKSAKEATRKSGIDLIIPNADIEERLFDPCGYSMNGIFENGAYMTIHITPEEDFSYVSFETNAPLSSYKDIIHRVLDTFHPSKFLLTLFANKASVAYPTHREIDRMVVAQKEWMRIRSQFYSFINTDLTCAFYTKLPS